MTPFQIRFLLIGLRLEVRTPGMRLTAKAPKCSTLARRQLGLKGKPPALLTQVEALVADLDRCEPVVGLIATMGRLS